MLKNIKNFLVISKFLFFVCEFPFVRYARACYYIYICRTYFDLLFCCGLCSFLCFFPSGYMDKLK